jgi:hypothetical protein
MVADRAKLAFDKAFGGSTHYECFHLAHNWEDGEWLTPEQRAACRYIRYLSGKQWEASRIVRQWYSRVSAESPNYVQGLFPR